MANKRFYEYYAIVIAKQLNIHIALTGDEICRVHFSGMYKPMLINLIYLGINGEIVYPTEDRCDHFRFPLYNIHVNLYKET